MAHFNYLNSNTFGESHSMYDNVELDTILGGQHLEGNLNDSFFPGRSGLLSDPLEEFGLFAEKLYEKNNLILKDINFFENQQKNYILERNSEIENNQQITPVFNEESVDNDPYQLCNHGLQIENTKNNSSVQTELCKNAPQLQQYNLENDYDNNKHKNTNMKDPKKANVNNYLTDCETRSDEMLIGYNQPRISEYVVAKPSTFHNPNYLNHWSLNLKVVDSSVSCLSIGINYNGYSGKILQVYEDHPCLVNTYARIHDERQQCSLALSLYQGNERLSSVLSVKQRVKFIRNIDDLHGSVENIVYKTSAVFGMNNPYEPQYYRFEVDNNGNLKNETKCGMCPYCEEVKFLPFKNSSYLSHLTLEHGIFSNNYLTPNGLYYGTYIITKRDKGKNDKILKSRKVDGIQCPHCFTVIEVGCWSMKSNKLLSYFRHFKNEHGDELDVLKYDALQEPQINIRGRRLKVLN